MITGSLQVKKDMYYAVLNLKVDGKRKPKWVATGLAVKGNKRKAELALRDIIAEYEAMSDESSSDKAKFIPYLNAWLETVKPTLSILTYTGYQQMISGRITRWFKPKNLNLTDITAGHLESFYGSIFADGCNANTVIHYHAVIRKALQSAVRKDLIEKNIADKVERPKKNVFKASHYSKEEVYMLLKLIEGDKLELVVRIAAYYGLRRSEVLGLRWSAIDFDKKVIHINHKVVEACEGGKTVIVCEDKLKTKSSNRALPLIPAIETALLKQKERQEMYKSVFKKGYSNEYLDYICTDELGNILRPNFVTEHFAMVLKKNGLRRIRFHDLRHTCASLLLDSGVSMKQIQVWLGHSTFSTTADIYAHLDYAAQVQTGSVMGTMFDM